MPYSYLEHIATADVAFKAWGKDPEEMFIAAADATMNVMVEDLTEISLQEEKDVSSENETLDMLLFQFLQEFIYYKDAEQLLLRVSKIHIRNVDGRFILDAKLRGEMLDANKHHLHVDIKAITLHRFQVVQEKGKWNATVVADI